MSDSYTEVESESWFSRIGGAIKGVAFGGLLFLVSFVVLFWNEGRAVKRAKALTEGKGLVVAVKPDQVDPAQEGKLVHVSGPVTTDAVLEDAEFGISKPGLALHREVEMYQWEEKEETVTKDTVGGVKQKETRYEYDQDWSPRLIDSDDFKIKPGHQNPTEMPLVAQDIYAESAALGAFQLTPAQIRRLNDRKDLTLSQADLERLPANRRSTAVVHEGRFYMNPWTFAGTVDGQQPTGQGRGVDPSAPEIGDVRVRFYYVEPSQASILARQTQGTFEPFTTSNNQTLDMIQVGKHSSEEMFAQAESANRTMTWILRGVGYAMMAGGLGMIFAPLVVVASVVPLLGDVLQLGVKWAAGLLAFVLSALTVGVAWLFYRPMLAIVLFAIAAAGIFAIVALVKRSKAKQAAAAV